MMPGSGGQDGAELHFDMPKAHAYARQNRRDADELIFHLAASLSMAIWHGSCQAGGIGPTQPMTCKVIAL